MKLNSVRQLKLMYMMGIPSILMGRTHVEHKDFRNTRQCPVLSETRI